MHTRSYLEIQNKNISEINFKHVDSLRQIFQRMKPKTLRIVNNSRIAY